MKKKLISLAIAMSFSASTSVFAQGVPVGDAATWAGLAANLAQLQQTYETVKKQYDAVTGSYGRGLSGLTDSIQKSSVVPGSWQEVVAQQSSGTFGASQGSYEKIIQTLPQELFQNPNGQTATSYKLSTDSVRAALTGGDALYSEVQTHLNNLASMAAQVDTTVNAKDAADLQNRISTENGMLTSAMAKLNVMNTNLQANLLNQQNQASASIQQRYKRADQ
ncbi:hypothetical protein LT85_p018 (plasmid) [Collimonas arenae]|uniref:Type IV secretion system protein VirB5 n=2 Tax=Collimonas arenae TaxID=279058 RepID=A0A0A1FML8_9BURK|nr:hypothetical protein LT85_p018 [Collimonas arenae]